MKDKKLRRALEAKEDAYGEITLESLERLERQIGSLARAQGLRVHYDGSVSKDKNN